MQLRSAAALAGLSFLVAISLCDALRGVAKRELISHSGPNFFSAFETPRSKRSASHDRTKRQWGGNYLIQSRPLDQSQASFLINTHNNYRKMVNAADMEYMFWDENLAYQAQAYADTCDFRHSNNRVNTGENIWAAPWANFENAVKLWFDETYYARCQCRDVFNHCCGHYTQVVWATSNRMGCGYAQCNDIIGAPGRQYVLICQYQPAGNLIGPYGPLLAFQYGDSCSRCPDYASDCYEGLCVPPGYYQKKK